MALIRTNKSNNAPVAYVCFAGVQGINNCSVYRDVNDTPKINIGTGFPSVSFATFDRSTGVITFLTDGFYEINYAYGAADAEITGGTPTQNTSQHFSVNDTYQVTAPTSNTYPFDLCIMKLS